MTFRKILCPTDFSAGSQHALQIATRMARETKAQLVIAHAWYIPATAYSLEAPFPPYVAQTIVDDAQRALDATVSEAIAAGATNTTGKLFSGLPWMKIVDELESGDYDVCILGSHGRSGLARVLLGSVAEKVVRHAPCSVLAVRKDEPFEHALVPTDFSESAAFAVDLATTLVGPSGRITLLHVIEVPVAYSGEITIADFARDLDRHATAALDNELARIKRVAPGLKVDARSRIGYPGAQALAALDDDPTVELVVMGSHGRTGIKRALMGSVAEKVVRHARCAVLVARKRRERSPS